MNPLKMVNLALAFVLEMCLLVIFGFWGVSVSGSFFQKIILGAGLPILLALIWGKYLAPASKSRLKEPWLIFIKLFIFFLAILALFSLHQWIPAIIFGITSMVNIILLYIYKWNENENLIQ